MEILYARGLCTMEGTRQQGLMVPRAVVGRSQSWARSRDLQGSVSHLYRNFIVEEQRSTKRIAKKNLTNIIIEVAFSCNDPNLIQGHSLPDAYSLNSFGVLQNFGFGISKLLSVRTFTNLDSDAICSHLRKSVHEKRSLIKMWTYIVRAGQSILAAVRRYSSLSVRRNDVWHAVSSLQLDGGLLCIEVCWTMKREVIATLA